jgi:hypothetical protein
MPSSNKLESYCCCAALERQIAFSKITHQNSKRVTRLLPLQAQGPSPNLSSGRAAYLTSYLTTFASFISSIDVDLETQYLAQGHTANHVFLHYSIIFLVSPLYSKISCAQPR